MCIRDSPYADARHKHYDSIHPSQFAEWFMEFSPVFYEALKPDGSLVINIKDKVCLLYTSDAADERSSVDLGGRRIIKKKKNKKNNGCEGKWKNSPTYHQEHNRTHTNTWHSVH